MIIFLQNNLATPLLFEPRRNVKECTTLNLFQLTAYRIISNFTALLPQSGLFVTQHKTLSHSHKHFISLLLYTSQVKTMTFFSKGF